MNRDKSGDRDMSESVPTPDNAALLVYVKRYDSVFLDPRYSLIRKADGKTEATGFETRQQVEEHADEHNLEGTPTSFRRRRRRTLPSTTTKKPD